MTAIEVIRAALSDFDDEVIQGMEDGERADLWTEIEVPVEALRFLLAQYDELVARR